MVHAVTHARSIAGVNKQRKQRVHRIFLAIDKERLAIIGVIVAMIAAFLLSYGYLVILTTLLLRIHSLVPFPRRAVSLLLSFMLQFTYGFLV